MATINTKRISSEDPNDLYRTHPDATRFAISGGVFKGCKSLWDCCDGLGGISDVLQADGFAVKRSDIKTYGSSRVVEADFLTLNKPLFDCDAIVMNPPYKLTFEFVEKALQLSSRVIMFNRASFLESGKRGGKFKSGEWPLSDVFIHSKRVGCAKGFSKDYANAVMYCWYVFDESCVGKHPRLHWL